MITIRIGGPQGKYKSSLANKLFSMLVVEGKVVRHYRDGGAPEIIPACDVAIIEVQEQENSNAE